MPENLPLKPNCRKVCTNRLKSLISSFYKFHIAENYPGNSVESFRYFYSSIPNSSIFQGADPLMDKSFESYSMTVTSGFHSFCLAEPLWSRSSIINVGMLANPAACCGEYAHSCSSIERQISDLGDFLINVARYAVSDIRTILSIGKRFKCFNHQFVMAVITIPASPKIFGGVIKTRMIMWALNIPES